MEPVDTASIQPVSEETIVMEPVIMQPYNVQGLVEEEESQRVMDPVTAEESHYDDK